MSNIVKVEKKKSDCKLRFSSSHIIFAFLSYFLFTTVGRGLSRGLMTLFLLLLESELESLILSSKLPLLLDLIRESLSVIETRADSVLLTVFVRGHSIELSMWLVYQSSYLDLYLLTIPPSSQITSLLMEVFIHLLSDVLFRLFPYVDSYHHHR